MFFTVEKLKRNTEMLRSLRYRERQEIRVFRMSASEDGPVGKRPDEVEYVSEFHEGDFWSGRGNYVWLAQKVQVPAGWTGGKIAGLFHFGKTGSGYNSGFESLLYVDGVPYQGVGSFHEEVIFPAGCAGKEVELTFRLWAGLEGGGAHVVQNHQFRYACLCLLDENADAFYYACRAVVETVQALPENDPVRSELVKALDQAQLLIDWRGPGTEEFYQSIERAGRALQEKLAEIEYYTPVTVHTVGHSHIDVAWLWQLKHTREKAARTFSTMCTLMEQYPEFIFIQSQPQLYKFIKKDYPDIYERIKKAVKAGNWEPNGGMWLEADCNITSGESLVRQLLMGKAFFEKEFGVRSNVLWLPDVFGYSWALPQILKKSGIDTFMTIKISWNQYNHMPHDTFWWRGIDGTRVLAHFMTTPENDGDRRYTYNGQVDPDSVIRAWNLYHDKEVNQDLLLACGYGDGGGGTNRDMLEMARQLAHMPGVPRVSPQKPSEYFEHLHETVENSDRFVHVWDGELYLEYHRGTYTSQARNKRYNRKTELMLRELEWLCTAAALRQKDFSSYPQEELTEVWETVLRNQFHDIIPGSSIHEVYEDSAKEYERAWEILDDIRKRASRALLESADERQEERAVTLVNTGNYFCPGLVFVGDGAGGGKDGRWYREDGTELQSVRCENGWMVAVPDPVPGGFLHLNFKEEETPAERMEETAWDLTAETSYYRVRWNEKGQIISLYDKENDRQVLLPGRVGNQLMVYEDRPLEYDAWDIDLFYREKSYEVEDLREVSVQRSSLMTEICMRWNYRSSSVSQKIRLYEKSRRIDFVTEADWQEHQQLLKVLFPVDVRATEATFDIQYGNVKRPAHENTSWDMAKFETVGHQWADISETGYGVSLLNDCKYGYHIKNNVIGLSLIKSAVHPDTAADIGRHVFTYALYPHRGSWQEAGVQKLAWDLNNPVWALEGKTAWSGSLWKLDAEHVAVDCIKKAEETEDVIVRVHEFEGRRGMVSLQTGFPVSSWQETNLMEEPEGEVQTGSLEFLIKPYEIRTFRLTFQK